MATTVATTHPLPVLFSSMPPFYQRSKKPRNRRGANPAYARKSLNVHKQGVIPAAIASVIRVSPVRQQKLK